MDQAKAALDSIGDGGGIGMEDAKTAIQAAMDKKGDAKGGEGGNPLAGMVSSSSSFSCHGDTASQQKKGHSLRSTFIISVGLCDAAACCRFLKHARSLFLSFMLNICRAFISQSLLYEEYYYQ